MHSQAAIDKLEKVAVHGIILHPPEPGKVFLCSGMRRLARHGSVEAVRYRPAGTALSLHCESVFFSDRSLEPCWDRVRRSWFEQGVYEYRWHWHTHTHTHTHTPRINMTRHDYLATWSTWLQHRINASSLLNRIRYMAAASHKCEQLVEQDKAP